MASEALCTVNQGRIGVVLDALFFFLFLMDGGIESLYKSRGSRGGMCWTVAVGQRNLGSHLQVVQFSAPALEGTGLRLARLGWQGAVP